MSKPVQIDLGGQQFTLRTEDTEEHVKACAKLVNERLDELRKKGAPAATIGLFVAMTLADDLLKLQRGQRDLSTAVRDELRKLQQAVG